jgi:hypothetical protein
VSLIYSVADPDLYVFGHLDPDPLVRGTDPDPLVRGTDPNNADPDPDHSIISKNSKKNLDSYCFATSTFYLQKVISRTASSLLALKGP